MTTMIESYPEETTHGCRSARIRGRVVWVWRDYSDYCVPGWYCEDCGNDNAPLPDDDSDYEM